MRLVVCVTGASGAVYARRFLDVVSQIRTGRLDADVPGPLEVDWVASSTAAQVWHHELGEDLPASLDAGEIRRFDHRDFTAPFASGSSAPDAVVCIPCSMSTLARVAHGGGDDLIARACEVALKERKRLILVVRETPLSLVHLRNMVAATEAGAVVLPAVPSFYGERAGLEAAIDTVIQRALDQVGITAELGRRWGTR